MTSVLEDPRTTPSPAPAPASGVRTRRRRLADLLVRHRTTLLYVVPLMVLTGVASRVGLAGSPQRIDDEGTYTAQAYAVEKLGELTHYTFWYDHPPLGWIQIAGWTWLTDAFGRYDVAVLAGREAMVAAHVVSALLLWMLARRLDLSRPGAAGAVALYALSPLTVQFTRTVYLDNIATPWMVAAFVLALTRRRQLIAFVGAALCFGIAVLSKETYLLLLPFLAWQMWRVSDKETRRYTLSVSGSLLTLVLGAYAAFALVKGEVFPGSGRVSLLGGVEFQLLNRASSGSVFDATSQVGRSVGVWLTLDPVLAVTGVLSAVVAVVFLRRLRPVAAALLGLTVFVLKPGYLPVPYVIAMIPFAALLVAALVDATVRRRGRRWTVLGLVAATLVAAVAAPLWAVQLRGLWQADLDRPLREATSWMESNVSPQDRLLVDDAVWVDLVRSGFPRDNVVWYYKADTDPAVSALAPNGWRDYDWVLVTQALRRSSSTAPTVQKALDNGSREAVFGSGETEVDVYRVHPEGIGAYQDVSTADTASRTAAGRALLGNPRLTFSGRARSLVEEGHVDSRAVTLLAQLSGDNRLTVEDFPAVFGEQGQAPRRTIELSGVDGGPVSSRAGAEVADAARAQTGPYRPDKVRTSGQQLTIRYDVADPSDLLPQAAP